MAVRVIGSWYYTSDYQLTTPARYAKDCEARRGRGRPSTPSMHGSSVLPLYISPCPLGTTGGGKDRRYQVVVHLLRHGARANAEDANPRPRRVPGSIASSGARNRFVPSASRLRAAQSARCSEWPRSGLVVVHLRRHGAIRGRQPRDGRGAAAVSPVPVGRSLVAAGRYELVLPLRGRPRPSGRRRDERLLAIDAERVPFRSPHDAVRRGDSTRLALGRATRRKIKRAARRSPRA